MIGRTRVPHRPPLRGLASLAGLLACFGAAGCVIINDPSPSSTTPIDGPPRDQFDDLGLLMGKRCGTLDCHGQVGRNLRIYSQDGLRLSTADVPGGRPTTTAELDADYESAIALQPEIMNQVVKDGGKDPDRLTLVRKPRAEEHHKGGQLFVIGDPQDICMTSWLASNVDTANCTLAIKTYP